MKLKKINFIKTLWGLEIDFSSKETIRNALISYKNEGFDGIEVATGFFPLEHKFLFNEIRKDLDLKLITQIHTMGYPVLNNNIEDHLIDFKQKMEDSKSWEADHINCHSGRDSFSYEENIRFFEQIEKIEEDFSNTNPNISISHETHRQRSLYSPWSSNDILKKCKNFKITLDISHWVVVGERFIDKNNDNLCKELLENVSKRTKLIHARVGTPNSIQVHRPRNDCENTKYFENVWNDILLETKENEIFITPEYGPFPYKPLSINSNGELNDNNIDLNETVLISLNRLKKLFLF
jgi:hypothetical protein